MLREIAGGVTLAVRAQPGAKKTAIVGIYGEGVSAQLKIAVQAQPIEGRANEALIDFLAETFGVPKRSVELVGGELSRSKVFLRGTLGSPDSYGGPRRCSKHVAQSMRSLCGWVLRRRRTRTSSGSGRTRKSAWASAKTTLRSFAMT